jgi:hypothetical protein
MSKAILENRQPKASGQKAVHVLEVMTGILASGEKGEFVRIASCAD